MMSDGSIALKQSLAELSEVAFSNGCDHMKLAIAEKLFKLGFTDAARVAAHVPNPISTVITEMKTP